MQLYVVSATTYQYVFILLKVTVASQPVTLIHGHHFYNFFQLNVNYIIIFITCTQACAVESVVTGVTG